MVDSKPDTNAYDLVKAVLIPFDTEPFVEYFNDIKSEASETSWRSFFQRISNIGLLCFTLGIIMTFLMLLMIEGFEDIPLPSYGVPYLVGFAIIMVFLLAKFVVQTARSINEPYELGDRERVYLFLSVQFTLGLLFLSGVGLILVENYRSVEDVLVIVTGILLTIGVLFTGIGLSLGSIVGFYRTYFEV